MVNSAHCMMHAEHRRLYRARCRTAALWVARRANSAANSAASRRPICCASAGCCSAQVAPPELGLHFRPADLIDSAPRAANSLRARPGRPGLLREPVSGERKLHFKANWTPLARLGPLAAAGPHWSLSVSISRASPAGRPACGRPPA